MKKTLAKTLRSALSLVLALVMVLGTVGTTFAAQPSKDDLEDAVVKLIDVLEQYGPDVVEEARQYVDKHGYVKAVKETASALKAALEECAAEHEFLAETIEEQLAGPIATLESLWEQAQNLVTLIALYKAGAATADSAAIINIPGIGEINTDEINDEAIKDFDINDLTEDQKKAIEDSGLIGDIKIDDLSDEQVQALKDAGLKGEIDPTYFSDAQLKDLQKAQNNLNATIEAIETTQKTVDALQAKLDELKAEIERLKEAAEDAENLTDTIISILEKGAVEGAELATKKYVEARDELFDLLEGLDKPYMKVADLAADIVELTVTIITEVKDLTVFVAKDVLTTVKNNKLLFAGAFVKAAEELGISQETLEKAAEKMLAVAEKVSTLIKELAAKAYKAYKDATTADLYLTYGANYVAIGDDAVLADNSYADLLNAALYLPVEADKSMADYGLLIQDVELDAAAIEDAELITIGFSTANFAGAMADAALGNQVNWSKYLPSKGEAAIDEAMDEVEKYIEALGFTGEIAKALTAAVESMAFNSLAYAYCLPKTIAAIRDINEDAVLVVVGLDNPLEDVSVAAAGKTLGLDLMSSALVALTDIYTLAYAILANNCTFVSAPNARNDFEGTTITKDNVAASLLSEGLLPNAEGHNYIKNRIYNALNVSYGYLWGDANLDAQITYVDALMILRHSVGLSNDIFPVFCRPICDVDGVAGIAYVDALMVLRRSVGLKDVFPVEK